MRLSVAPEEVNRDVKVLEDRQAVSRHRTGNDVASHGHLIDPFFPDLVQNGLQRREVAVNVVDRRQTHSSSQKGLAATNSGQDSSDSYQYSRRLAILPSRSRTTVTPCAVVP